MSANKSQFVALLAANSGLTLAQAEAATNALSETTGQWLHDNGQNGPGSFAGEIEGGQKFEMSRSMSTAPHWTIKSSFTTAGLNDLSDGSGRFGLPVENG